MMLDSVYTAVWKNRVSADPRRPLLTSNRLELAAVRQHTLLEVKGIYTARLQIIKRYQSLF